MKLNKILTAATIAAAFSASLTTGCYEGEMYDVGQPDWLTDSVSAVADRAAANAGGSSFAAESVTADAWWTAWSKTYNFPENQRMTIEITLDKSTREKRWKNFAMVVATSGWEFPASGQPNGVEGYGEYFVVRGDAGNWNGTGNVTVTADESLDLANENFVSFQEDGSKFTIVAEHYPTGSILIKSTQVTPSGSEYHWSANGTAEAGSGCQVFFAGEGSTFTITNITYETLEELMPIKLEVSGTPTAVEVTEEEVEPSYYYGDGVATVTWSNGTTSTVGIDELTFSVVPDLKTVGTALVTVAYAKTSMGQFCEPVSTGYKLEVAGEIESIKINPVSETPTYYYVPGTTEIKKEDINVVSYIKSVVGVSGTTELPLSTDSYTTDVTIPSTISAGQKITIKVTYKDLTTTLDVTLEAMATEPLKIDLVANKDAFEFNGTAKMLNDEILMIESGKGGMNGNYVILKESGWLKDKIVFNDVATISFDAYPTTVEGTDWSYLFCIGTSEVAGGDKWSYLDGTIGFIQRFGDPYFGFFPGDGWVDGNKMGGTTTVNPFNYFLLEDNCNKWYHFDYVYSTTEVSIYVNGVKTVAHTLTADQSTSLKGVLSTLNEGKLMIGCGANPTLENFGGYMANVTIRNVNYHQTSDFYSAEIPE